MATLLQARRSALSLLKCERAGVRCPDANSRRANQRLSPIGSQKVSPPSVIIAVTAASIGTPTKVSIAMAPASNAPGLTGMKAALATTFAMTNPTPSSLVSEVDLDQPSRFGLL